MSGGSDGDASMLDEVSSLLFDGGEVDQAAVDDPAVAFDVDDCRVATATHVLQKEGVKSIAKITELFGNALNDYLLMVLFFWS